MPVVPDPALTVATPLVASEVVPVRVKGSVSPSPVTLEPEVILILGAVGSYWTDLLVLAVLVALSVAVMATVWSPSVRDEAVAVQDVDPEAF